MEVLANLSNSKKQFDFSPKTHWDLCESLNLTTASTAAKITGTRFMVYKNFGAQLERALINFMLDTHKKAGIRDLTLMVLLYATAARIDELLSIKIKDLYLTAGKPYVIITGKGGKIRTLYLLPKAVGFLQLYLKKFHGESPISDDYLFYSSIHGRNTKLSQQAVHKVLRKYAASANEKCQDVPLDLHAHQFRHAKASHWLEDGMNIVQISFLLGHSSVETTMVYLDITTEQEMKALATLEDEKNQNVSVKWDPSKDTLSDLCRLRKLAK